VSEHLLTVHDVAQRLRVSPGTVRRWLRDGKLRGSRFGGDRIGYRVRETEVERLIASGETASVHV
jgi:excisionase family DNA binding protein